MKSKSIFKGLFATAISSLFIFATATSVYAFDFTKPIAVDCGNNGTPCNLFTDGAKTFQNMYIWMLFIIVTIIVVEFAIAAAKNLFAEDQAATLKSVKAIATNSLTTLLGLVALVGGVLWIFIDQLVSKPQIKNTLQLFKASFNETPTFGVSRAYAAGGLPNVLVVNNFYDLLVIFYQLAMRWVLVPILIASWVWVGFLFVAAQGNPEKIKYAKGRLLSTVVWTIILMFILGLAFALQGTFNQILS